VAGVSTPLPSKRSSAVSLPRGEEKGVAVEAMFDRIAGRYDRVNRIMTFRLDVGWRRRTVASLDLIPGSRVLDLACGTGDLCRDLAAVGLLPYGVDFSAGMLEFARTTAPLIRADALRLPMPDASVDGVTCGFALRNFVSLEPFFAECARVLRPGGRIALLDAAEPENTVFRVGHHVYFRKVVPFIGGLLSDREAYRYLPASLAYLPPPPALRAMATDAGFAAVRRESLGLGAAQLITGVRG
jgi:demethylmenaquinone methyltransferase/2-methoxy-6-polyprenyl-1,4-benzoquinol methylase